MHSDTTSRLVCYEYARSIALCSIDQLLQALLYCHHSLADTRGDVPLRMLSGGPAHLVM